MTKEYILYTLIMTSPVKRSSEGWTAKSIFDLNITSSTICIKTFKALSELNVIEKDIHWLLRSAVVFMVSALDCYFHDKIRYRLGEVTLDNLPNSLAQLPITISDLVEFTTYQRSKAALTKLVVDHISSRQIVGSSQIPEYLKLVDIKKTSGIKSSLNKRKGRHFKKS